MIIFGWRGRASTASQGSFCCPDCGPGTAYRLQVVKRWFTLYFIPVIPLQELGRYVECSSCNGTFKERVLEFDPAAAVSALEAEFAAAARQVMLRMAAADGSVEPEELDAIAESYQRITGREVSADDLAAEAEDAMHDRRPVADYLRGIAPRLNEAGKEKVLRAAITVARADGHIDPAEAQLLTELGSALDMPRAYARGVLAEEGVAA